jgi:hypothetical protein
MDHEQSVKLLVDLYPVLLEGRKQVFAKECMAQIEKFTGMRGQYFSTKGISKDRLLTLVSDCSEQEIAYVSTTRTDRGHIVMYKGANSIDPYYRYSACAIGGLTVYPDSAISASPFSVGYKSIWKLDIDKYLYVFHRPMKHLAAARSEFMPPVELPEVTA